MMGVNSQPCAVAALEHGGHPAWPLVPFSVLVPAVLMSMDRLPIEHRHRWTTMEAMQLEGEVSNRSPDMAPLFLLRGFESRDIRGSRPKPTASSARLPGIARSPLPVRTPASPRAMCERCRLPMPTGRARLL